VAVIVLVSKNSKSWTGQKWEIGRSFAMGVGGQQLVMGKQDVPSAIAGDQ
jgi:hypothetical protein